MIPAVSSSPKPRLPDLDERVAQTLEADRLVRAAVQLEPDHVVFDRAEAHAGFIECGVQPRERLVRASDPSRLAPSLNVDT